MKLVTGIEKARVPTTWVTPVGVEVTQNNGRIWNLEKYCELSSKAFCEYQRMTERLVHTTVIKGAKRMV